VARTRTTKKVAQRINLNYFKRATPLKRAKLWLSVLLPVVALGWIAWMGFARDSRVYSSGRLSGSHAVFEKECAACHVQTAEAFAAKAEKKACLDCHDGPAHHPVRVAELECRACHVEHQGRVNLSAARNQACATCHADLRAAGGTSNFSNNIHSLEDGHPEFLALRDNARDPGTIKLNHALHMKPIKKSANGPEVQLLCGDCHRTAAVKAAWPYADAKYVNATTAYSEKDELLPIKAETMAERRPRTERELMAPPQFATACASCHLLTFDKRFDESVPHDKPEVVHAFMVKKFTEYISAHPNELREVSDPERKMTGRPAGPAVRLLTLSEWIAEKTMVAEELLWHKTCAQCHTVSTSPLYDTFLARWSAGSDKAAGAAMAGIAAPAESLKLPVPTVAGSKTTQKWLPHAKFDHDAHRGFRCESCHAKALKSTETSDVLIPGIANCRTCHAPGPDHAEARCFECHTYHDWAKRKEVTPKFTLPALRIGGH
jgi:decaheme cytochrome c component MtrC/MtrF-like protein